MVLYWDFDGTLVHSEHLWSRSVFQALKAVVPNTPLSVSDIYPHMAHGFPWHTPEQDNTKLVGERWWAYMNTHFYRCYLALGLEPVLAQRASLLVRKLLLEPEHYILYPDCHTTLAACVDRGYHNVLLSNNHPDLEPLMQQLGLDKYFERFIISGEVGYDKPRIEIFSLAKSFYPSEAAHVMIGDSFHADILGGNAAGMQTILVHKPPTTAANATIQSLRDILSVLPSLIKASGTK